MEKVIKNDLDQPVKSQSEDLRDTIKGNGI